MKEKMEEKENKKKLKIKLIKISVALIIIAVLTLCIIYMWPILKQISTKEGQIAFKEQINSLGFKGILLLFSMQVAQILLVVLPGEPFEIIAGMCYGSLRRSTIYYNISINYNNNYIFYSKKIRTKIFI